MRPGDAVMAEQPERFPQAVPEVYASLRPIEAVAVWIAYVLGPAMLLLQMWLGADAMPTWLGPQSPVQWISLLLTLGMVIMTGDIRRTPEFWLLVVFWVGWGVPFLAIKLGISFVAFVVPFVGVAAVAAAAAFPIVGIARLAVHLCRSWGTTKPG